MTEIILSKESSESEIKRYFNAVLKLSKADNEFPINLDEVWPLVYQRKDHAVRDLTSEFIQDVDYKVFLKNGENPNGGRPSNEYILTVSCMEFFIARKVRPVFDVYRRVFHRVAEKKQLTRTDVRASLAWVRGVSDILNLNEVSKLALLEKVAEPHGLPLPTYAKAEGVYKSATNLLKEKGYKVSIHVFYKKAIEQGIIKRVSRTSSKKGVKYFNAFTDNGLEYGENGLSPNNPKETQPNFYEDKFDSLMDMLGFTKEEEVADHER